MENGIPELFNIPESVIYINSSSLSPQLRSVTEAGMSAVQDKKFAEKI